MNSLQAQFRDVVLLGGLVRPTPLSKSIDRSVLDLPIDGQRSVFDLWHHHLATLAQELHHTQLPVRVAIDRQSVVPRIPHGDSPVAITIERDEIGLRGTGGVLHDLSSEHDDKDYILVANAAQVLLQPLAPMVAELSAANADVAMISHAYGIPTSLMLIRCEVLRSIASIGFVDLKEQLLPKITPCRSVRVIHWPHPTGMPIQTLNGYIQSLRAIASDDKPMDTRLKEDWNSTFSIIENGAIVDPSAIVHDSVVLRGSRVDRNAVIIRSVVCQGAVVKRNSTVTDQLVSPNTTRDRKGGRESK